MTIRNLTNSKGKSIPNQIVIRENDTTMFVSYGSIIYKEFWLDGKYVKYLDEKYWNYSTTTSKYRNQFLGETTKEIEKKIKDGIYILTDLNK